MPSYELPDFCPDCGFPWVDGFDYCVNCQLTIDDIDDAEDYIDSLENEY